MPVDSKDRFCTNIDMLGIFTQRTGSVSDANLTDFTPAGKTTDS